MMERSTVLTILGVGATVTGLGVATRYAGFAPVRLPSVAAESPTVAPESGLAERDRADSLARVIAARDAFRMSRAPAAVPFNADVAANPYSAPPARSPRPALALAGIVLGGEPLALIDGLPGVEGSRVMRVGERAGDYVLRAITADRVVIAAPDTTWTLRVRSQYP